MLPSKVSLSCFIRGVASFAGMMLRPLSVKTFLLWFAGGLALRLLLSPLYGTQDVEWQKAWAKGMLQHGMTRVYGAPDAEILGRIKDGQDRAAVRAATQTVLSFQPYRYFRTEYLVTYPPGYLYVLNGSARVYGFVAPGLPNGRLFNVFINLPSILAAAALTLAIAAFAGSLLSPAAGYGIALLYWLNPVAILNSPIQGYQDPLCALFAVLAVLAIFRRRVVWACVFLAAGMLVKPQAVLVAPVVLGAGLLLQPALRNLWGWLAGALVALMVLSPWLLAGRGLSVLQGVLSVTDSSGDLSRQALNLWWPVQYAWNAVEAVRGGLAGWDAFAGGAYGWYADVPAALLEPRLGFSPGALGLLLLAAFTGFNLYHLARRCRKDPLVIVEASALQVYAYFILRAGVQGNHYYLLVPLLALACLRPGATLRFYGAVSLVFLLQDLIFYGFGRDFNFGKQVLSRLHLGWTTNVLALANIVLFGMLCRHFYRRGRSAPAP
jgi:hypothetical protein